MENLTPLLLIFIAALVILCAWNAWAFYSFKKNSSLSDKLLNDSKYWELKYKYEFVIAIVGILAAAAGFIGYNTLNSVKTEISNTTKLKVDSVVSTFDNKVDSIKLELLNATGNVNRIKDDVDQTATNLKRFKAVINSYKIDQRALTATNQTNRKDLNSLMKDLNEVQKNAILKQPFYFISNYPIKGGDGYHYINFNDLTSVNGSKLPNFKKPPLILFSPSELAYFTLIKVNLKGLQFLINPEGMDGSIADDTIFKVSFLILEVPE